MSGKRVPLPCGHLGEHIIGQYVACPVCDREAVPEHVDDRRTQPMCDHCGSTDVRVWPGMMTDGRNLWFCDGCQRSFFS